MFKYCKIFGVGIKIYMYVYCLNNPFEYVELLMKGSLVDKVS